MENGHTLHLVARQPAQSQDSSGTSAGETNGSNSNRGTEAIFLFVAYHIPSFLLGKISSQFLVTLTCFNGFTVNDASTGAPRNRVGQISHSVVLGTFNVGDQGEGLVPDLSRVGIFLIAATNN